MPPTVFTSIPAKLVRADAGGRDIGADYLRRCIDSWVEAGFRVVSLNGAAEAARLAEIASRSPAIEIRILERTAEARTGRPLPYLADMLEHCAAVPDAPVGLINADLYLHEPAALQQILAGADGRSLLYGRRLDVDAVDDLSDLVARARHPAAQPYVSGFDYFFFAPAMVRDLADEGLVFGESWWDYWLPLVLVHRGVAPRPAARPPVLHLVHDDSTAQLRRSTAYLDFFEAFKRALMARLPLPGDQPWDVQVRPLLAAFLRHAIGAATPTEQICLSQFLSCAMSLYLAQTPDLEASFVGIWRQVIARHAGADPEARRCMAALLETATTLGVAASA